MFAVFISASAAIAATAVVGLARFAGLRELALEVVQSHCGVYVWWCWMIGIVAMEDAQEQEQERGSSDLRRRKVIKLSSCDFLVKVTSSSRASDNNIGREKHRKNNCIPGPGLLD